MNKYKFVKEELSDAERVTLKECFQNHPDHRVRMRADAILQNSKGYPITILTDLYEVQRDTISLWISNWDKLGIVGLFDTTRSGRPRKLTVEEIENLVLALKEEPRSVKRLIGLAEEKFGKEVSGDTIKRMLRKLGQKWKRVKAQIISDKNTPQYVAAVAQLDSLQQKDAAGEINLQYFDATGFSLMPYIPYAWQLAGETILVNSNRSSRINVLGFMGLDCSLTPYTINGKVDSEVVINCFDNFTNTITQETWVILDNASIHTSAKFKAKISEWKTKGVNLFYLPPRAPELNKIEILWRFMKYHWLDFKAYLSFDNLKKYLDDLLCNIGSKYKIIFA